MKWSRQKPFLCGQCLKGFEKLEPMRQHVNDAHPDCKKVKIYRSFEVVEHPQDEEDESFADRAIQAYVDRFAGIPNDDDWLLP